MFDRDPLAQERRLIMDELHRASCKPDLQARLDHQRFSVREIIEMAQYTRRRDRVTNRKRVRVNRPV
jgi:hypothetical protein